MSVAAKCPHDELLQVYFALLPIILNTKEFPMKLSMIVPAYNEEANVRPFYEEVRRVFGGVQLGGKPLSCEIIFIDDGSKDNTYNELVKLVGESRNAGEHDGGWCTANDAATHDAAPVVQSAATAAVHDAAAPITVSAVSFSRNFGKEAALFCGLNHAQGDFIAFIDADLQQEPSTLLEMARILEADDDLDCVAACQVSRKKGITSSLSHAFYKVLASSSRMEVVQDASDFRVFRRCVADALLSMGDYQRFSKGLFSWVGFKTHAYPYTPSPRHAGTSTWSFWGLLRYAFNGLLSFSVAPLRAIITAGAFTSAAAFIYLIVVVVQRLAFGIDVPGYATIVVLILFLGGVQLLSIGCIGEYLSRMYIQGKRRPIYIERRFISTDVPSESAGREKSEKII